MKNIFKDEKGMISTFVGLSVIFFIIVLTGLYVSTNTLRKSRIG
ncbi:MAG: hypothetical protein Q4G05_02395 [Clostridia bacterium]|nr:hypothetical protein [Clostridia bacterium]